MKSFHPDHSIYVDLFFCVLHFQSRKRSKSEHFAMSGGVAWDRHAMIPRSPYALLRSSRSGNSNSMHSLQLEASDGNQLIKTHHPITTPRSETYISKPLIHSVSSAVLDIGAILIFDVQPLLIEAPPEKVPELFVRKCVQGKQICNFHNPLQVEVRQAKQDMLNDILNAVTSPKTLALLGETEYREFYHFIQKNIVRTVPPCPPLWISPICTDFALDRVEEAGWAHMSLVYDIFVTFVSNRKFNETFCHTEILGLIHGLIPMFQSADAREREKLMKVFISVYRQFPHFRRDVRRTVALMLNGFVQMLGPPVGCYECLMALLPVVQGLKVPLRAGNASFFYDVLLPLHRVPQLNTFHPALLQLMCEFLLKDPKMAKDVFRFLFKHWPYTSPTKKVLFLAETEILSEIVPQDTAVECVKMITKLICLAVADPGFQVAEKALVMWESDSFMKLITANSKIVFPKILPEIFKTATGHWCADVKTLALNAMRVLKGCDVETFDEVGRNFTQYENQKLADEMQKGTMWVELADAHATDEDKLFVRKRVSVLYLGCEAMLASEAPKKESVSSSPSLRGTPKSTAKSPPKASPSPRVASRYGSKRDRSSNYRASVDIPRRKK